MATLRNFGLNVVRTCTRGNYEQNWDTKMFNYEFTFLTIECRILVISTSASYTRGPWFRH